jgi:hypothetical protein
MLKVALQSVTFFIGINENGMSLPGPFIKPLGIDT